MICTVKRSVFPEFLEFSQDDFMCTAVSKNVCLMEKG
jgi:hypothetical protein